MSEDDLPAEFIQRIRGALGEDGAAWLRDLPGLAADLADRWQVTLGEPFELSYNYVARARRQDGTEVVFKVGSWGAETVQEIRALSIYGGVGSCRLMEADESRGAMLLERVRPGTMLRQVAADDDDAATRIAASLMRRLWRPADEIQDRSGLRPLSEWFRAFARHRAFYGGPGPFPERVMDHAEGVTRELLASAPAEVLLHADFHHDNVLASSRDGWLAIDPKGMLGDPGYEVGPFLLNPDPRPSPPRTPRQLARRLALQAANLALDRKRLRLWGIAHAVLSACWSAEGHGIGWQNAIRAAERLIDLPG